MKFVTLKSESEAIKSSSSRVALEALPACFGEFSFNSWIRGDDAFSSCALLKGSLEDVSVVSSS